MCREVDENVVEILDLPIEFGSIIYNSYIYTCILIYA